MSLLLFFCLLPVFNSCNKNKVDEHITKKGHHATSYSSYVTDKWIWMQLRLISSTGGPQLIFSRHYAYSGIVAFESVKQGMPGHQSTKLTLNGMPAMPVIEKNKKYHWPSSANAGLAEINRKMFSNTSAANLASIDSLENALAEEFADDDNVDIIDRTKQFGKAVAQLIFDWAETDGYKNANAAYTPPVGPGLWIKTPPAFANPVMPYWGKNRLLVTGSLNNSQPPPPTTYSEDPASDFYKMAKEVYDVSQTLTPEQVSMATFWRDAPGYSGAGHWLSILYQVLQKEKANLGRAAFAYMLTGVCLNESTIGNWSTKYQYNLGRPITYIRDVLGHSNWNSLLTTPPHPEYTSGHATNSSAAAEAMTVLFGNNYAFTDHSYDYLGMVPRSYNSFRAIATEVAISRVYAGIHYKNSCNEGLSQGRKIAINVINALKSPGWLNSDN